jgi:hypothetical protein
LNAKLAIVALALLGAACAPAYPIAPAGAAPQAAAPSAPAPRLAPRSAIPRPDVAVRDQCGATTLQGLVGRPRREVPVPLDPNRQRVACQGCPIAGDYDPARLNFFFDPDSGLIREVRCG